jgi:hypothetical protein
VAANPEPPVSVADRLTVTGAVVYQFDEQAWELQEMVVAGPDASTRISWDFTASALPAPSTE